jgi:hypothetical protein
MTSLRSHLTYANVVATLALVLAVAGGTSAIAISAKVKKNAVGTKQLKNGSVTPAKLRNGAVTVAKIADGNVTASKLAPTHVVVDHQAASVTALAKCPTGERLLSGGAAGGGGEVRVTLPEVDQFNPGATPTQWDALSAGGSTSDGYALCLQSSP